MKKKLLLIVILIICLSGYVIYKYSKPNINTSSQKELSERSKEFLKNQQSQGKLDFGGLDSTGKKIEKVVGSEFIDVGTCFSMTIPFPIVDDKDLGECFRQINVTSPRASINVYARDVSYSTLEEDSGVKMRRTEKNTYKEDKKTVNGKTFVIFKKTDAGYEKTALYLSGGKLIGINLLANINDDILDKKFDDMLESVEFK